MSIDQIKVIAAVRASDNREITVRLLDGTTITGTCTFAGKRKFRVDTPQAAIFFTYDECEAVE
jgi:hypothetical protein